MLRKKLVKSIEFFKKYLSVHLKLSFHYDIFKCHDYDINEIFTCKFFNFYRFFDILKKQINSLTAHSIFNFCRFFDILK